MAHRHVIGASGSGKTTLAKDWLIQDIKDGYGVCYIDPHGYDTDDLLNYIPAKRRKDVVVFDPSQFAISWNPLITENIPLTASTFVHGFKSAWDYNNMPTPRMDGVIYNALVALAETKQPLFGFYLLLASETYRTFIIKDIKDKVVQRYWTWFSKLNHKQQQEQCDSTLNKIQILMADPRIRAISGTNDVLNIKDMVKDKILFLRLPQGELGIEKTKLLGNIMLSQIHQACLSRETNVPYSIYIDEVHTFAPHIIKEMLSGIRKFNVDVTAIHQYTLQLDRTLLESLTANADQYIFKVSLDDSERLPATKNQDFKLWETPLFHYVLFTDEKYIRVATEEFAHTFYPASARQIYGNIRRNLVSPATKEVDSLLKRF